MIELHLIDHRYTDYKPTLTVTDARGIRRAWEGMVRDAASREASKGEPVRVRPELVTAVEPHRYKPYLHRCLAQTGGVKLEVTVDGEQLLGASLRFSARGRAAPMYVWETVEEVLALLESNQVAS